MAAWTNIFDLGDWDVYVKYYGVTVVPSPDSRDNWVLAADLDPTVGTVTVDAAGLIVCDFQSPSGGGGIAPSIVVMARTPISAPCRLTCSDVSGLSSDSSYFSAEVTSVTSVGAAIYDVAENSVGNVVNYASKVQWAAPTEAPSDLVSGKGMTFRNVSPGG